MPIIWRYIYKQFFKVFFLTMASFIFILLVTRLKEIARFVSLSPEPKYVFAFIFNIIPYILPIAIPIAALLSAIAVFQKLSRSHELTALRCAGYSLFSIMFPVLAVAFFFSLVNFFVVSELTSYSQVYSRRMINELITTNPLFMLEHKDKLRKRDLFVDMSALERGQVAENIYIITPDKDNKRLNLMFMDQLKVENNTIEAPHIGVVSVVESQKDPNKEHLVIENESSVIAKASDLTQIMHQTFLHLEPHHLTMPGLYIKINEMHNNIERSRLKNDIEDVKKNYRAISDLNSEIIRRLSIGLAVFTFTFIGISYSIEIGRNRKRKNLIMMTTLTIFGLLCFFTGKMFHHYFWLATFVYLIPHVISICFSVINVKRKMQGIE